MYVLKINYLFPDVASNHPLKDEFSPAYPPKIEEVLETIQNEDLKLILDVALPYPMSLEILVDYIINEIFAANHVKNKNLYSKVVLTSSWPHVIYAIRQRNPRIVSGLGRYLSFLKSDYVFVVLKKLKHEISFVTF